MAKKKRGSVAQASESAMPTLPTGLVRHSNGTYYYRRRIPTELLSVYTKKEETFSLKTKSYRDAVERFYREDARVQERWRREKQALIDRQVETHLEALHVLTTLTDEDIQRITEHVEAVALAGDEYRRESGLYDIAEIIEYQTAYRDVLPELRAAVAVGDVSVLVPLLTQFLALYRYDNRLSEEDLRRLAIAYGRAAIRVNEKLLKRYDGEDVPTPKPAERRSASSVTVAQVAEQYIDKEYGNGRKPAMAKKVRLVIPMLVDLLGKKLISELKQSDINHFFELVHKLWPRWADEARRTGKSWIALAKSNEDLSRGEIAPGTFEDTYRAAVSRFLAWAVTKDVLINKPADLNSSLLVA